MSNCTRNMTINEDNGTEQHSKMSLSMTIYASFSTVSICIFLFSFLSFLFLFASSLPSSVSSLCRLPLSLSLFQPFRFYMHRFCYLMCFWYHIEHLRVYQIVWSSRSGIHLAFIYSDTINHKRITSQTHLRIYIKKELAIERMRWNVQQPTMGNTIHSNGWVEHMRRTNHTHIEYVEANEGRKKNNKRRKRCKEEEVNERMNGKKVKKSLKLATPPAVCEILKKLPLKKFPTFFLSLALCSIIINDSRIVVTLCSVCAMHTVYKGCVVKLQQQ